MIKPELNLFDISLSIIIIIIIYIISTRLVNKSNSNYSKIFKQFIIFKIAFAVFFSLIYLYYYEGGDTFLYFSGGNYLVDQYLAYPSRIFEFLFNNGDEFKNLKYSNQQYLVSFFSGSDSLLTFKISSVFSLLCFKQFMATTILLTMVASIGAWKLFTTLCNLYPALSKYFAAGVLFYPTIAIWSSGILKDTITFMCVGLIFTSFYYFERRKNIIISLFISSISIYFCLILKPYILYLFIPCMLFWINNRIRGNIKNIFLKAFVGLFLIIIFSAAGFLIVQSISQGAGKYSLDSITDVAKGFQSWHTYLSETRNQSGYSLGEFEFTTQGIIQKIPAAIIVTFFRPFLFSDVTNFSLAFEGIQSFILLLLTAYVFLKVGIIRFFRIIIFNKDVSAFVLFALLFGITVGLTSYNFGALSRYKIPALPFYTASLAIIYYLGYLKPKELLN